MNRKLVINNIKVPYTEDENYAFEKAKDVLKKAGISYRASLKIHKRSLDARNKNNIMFVYSVIAEAIYDNKIDYSKIESSSGIKIYEDIPLVISPGKKNLESKIAIIGFGPAGIFAALTLAEAGYAPVVYERGGSVEERIKAVDDFVINHRFSSETNIQFGAGGAGTFSDGKLTTRIGDSLCSKVLRSLYELGAPEEILWTAKPHIGTDVLRKVVKNAEQRIISLGGQVIYHACLNEINENQIKVNGEWEKYSAIILATGHSARDTYKMLISKNYDIEAKPFSVGIRIEHLQSDINKAMFGELAESPKLGPAEYNLSYRKGEYGVYTFCMCPGGMVVPAASEYGGVVTNGMSNRARDGINANSALAVSVLPKDFSYDPVKAVEYQRELEQKAFILGGGDFCAPAQTVSDFLENKFGKEPSVVLPTYMNGNVSLSNLRSILPNNVSDMLEIGIKQFGKKIKGFDAPFAVMTGVETRTSAPMRILRDENFISKSNEYLYPCGEGAGYAGGIMSAAVDGIKVANKIISTYAPPI